MKPHSRLKKVLLVDDDEVTHLIVKRMVDYLHLPWELRAYSHPTQALLALNENDWTPDFALIDHHLPHSNGPELVEILHQQGHKFPWAWISSSLLKPEIPSEWAPEAFFTKPLVPDSLHMCDTLAQLAMLANEGRQD